MQPPNGSKRRKIAPASTSTEPVVIFDFRKFQEGLVSLISASNVQWLIRPAGMRDTKSNRVQVYLRNGRQQLCRHLRKSKVKDLKAFMSRHAVASVSEQAKRLSKNDLISLLADRFFGTKDGGWSLEARGEEQAVLKEIDFNSVFCSFQGISDTIHIPRELMEIVMSFCVHDYALVLSVGLVNEDFYKTVLSTWDEVVIREPGRRRQPIAIQKIPITCLRFCRTLDVQRRITKKEWHYLMDRIDRRRLTTLRFGFRNLVSGFKSCFGALADLAKQRAVRKKRKNMSDWVMRQRGTKLVGLRKLRVHPNSYMRTVTSYRMAETTTEISNEKCEGFGERLKLKDVAPNLQVAEYVPSLAMCSELPRLCKVSALFGRFTDTIVTDGLPYFFKGEGASRKIALDELPDSQLTDFDVYMGSRSTVKVTTLFQELLPKIHPDGLRSLSVAISCQPGQFHEMTDYPLHDTIDLSVLRKVNLQSLEELTCWGLGLEGWQVFIHATNLRVLKVGSIDKRSAGNLIQSGVFSLPNLESFSLVHREGLKKKRSEKVFKAILPHVCELPELEFYFQKFSCQVKNRGRTVFFDLRLGFKGSDWKNFLKVVMDLTCESCPSLVRAVVQLKRNPRKVEYVSYRTAGFYGLFATEECDERISYMSRGGFQRMMESCVLPLRSRRFEEIVQSRESTRIPKREHPQEQDIFFEIRYFERE